MGWGFRTCKWFDFLVCLLLMFLSTLFLVRLCIESASGRYLDCMLGESERPMRLKGDTEAISGVGVRKCTHTGRERERERGKVCTGMQ
jgi:hypothetical protein